MLFGPIYKLIDPIFSPGHDTAGKANKSKSVLHSPELSKMPSKLVPM